LIVHFCIAFTLVRQLEKELDEEVKFDTDDLKHRDSLVVFEMPNNPWDRRYYRQSFAQGLEVLLVKRIVGNKWVVLKPDMSFGTITLTARSTITTEPGEGICWTRMPLLTEGQKADSLRRAVDIIGSGFIGSIEMPLYRPGRQVRQAFLAQAALVAMSWPSAFARWARWGLRTPRRFVGLAAGIFLLYSLVDSFGVIDGVSAVFSFGRDLYLQVKQWAGETSDNAMEIISWIEEWHSFFTTYVSLRHGICVSIAIFVLTYVWVMEGDEVSTTSSMTGSPPPSDASDGSVVGSGPSSSEARALRDTIEKQSGLINDMLMAQNAMKQEIADARTAQRAAEIRANAQATLSSGPAPDGDGSENQAVIRTMMNRLDGFEKMLREHSGSSPGDSGQRARSTSGERVIPGKAVTFVEPLKAVESVSPATAVPKAPEKEKEKSGAGGDAIQRALKKMRLKSQRVSDVFAKQLEQHEEVDAEFWNSHFPPGFRERLAGEFIADIVSNDKTLEAWSRDFLRDRELLDCHPARELIATCSAMDAMIMTDTEAGLLNKVGFERLARKAYGLVQAYKSVQNKNDWLKPKSANDKWRSKVDWNAARQYDPSFRTEGVPTVLGAQEEVRKEQEREAALLKAKAKLAEHGFERDAPTMGS